MKEQYNHSLGIEVKSHLLNLGIETLRDLKYYQLTDHDRIRAIAKNVREINLVMGVVTDEMQSIKIAREIYGANKGLSYTYFPDVERKLQSKNGTTSLNTTVQNLFIKADDEWFGRYISLTYKGTFKHYDVKSEDINKIILFFSKRPFIVKQFKSLVEETVKHIYKTDDFRLYYERSNECIAY